MSDQAAISFVPLDPPTDGIVALFAEEGPKLTPIAKTIDKSSKGLLSRAAEISGFKGKKDSVLDLIAPSGLKFARLVLVGMDKPAKLSRGGLAQSRRQRAGAIHGQGGRHGSHRPRCGAACRVARGCCELRTRRAAPRLQIPKIQIQGEEEGRFGRRQGSFAEAHRHPLRQTRRARPRRSPRRARLPTASRSRAISSTSPRMCWGPPSLHIRRKR